MPPPKTLFSIGRMAKTLNASPKQLRYLESKGVLTPALRDRDNNYRYYTPDQFNRLAFVKTLRDMGVPFNEVVSALDEDSSEYLYEIIQGQIAQAQAEIKEALLKHERLTSYYTNLLFAERFSTAQGTAKSQNGACSAPECRIVEVPKQKVLTIRKKAAVTSKELFIDRFFALQQMCRDLAVLPAPGLHAIFHDGHLKQFDGVSEDLETFLVLPPDSRLTRNTREFGGFSAVAALYSGDYADMKGMYIAMMQWAEEQSLNVMKIAVERYLLGPDMTTRPERYLTQILLPLAGGTV